jgi:hypothetical protein
MGAVSNPWWPWIATAGLGAYHGVNPAMGWLFAVALGLHRKSRQVLFVSLIPIALGHAAAVAAGLLAVLSFGVLLERDTISRLAGIALIGWAVWHICYGHRRVVRTGMQTSLLGLAAWSFAMAGAHGAGLMLLPAILPLCVSQGPASGLIASPSWQTGLAALLVHTAAMFVVIAAVSVIVYEWVGLAFLRRNWINFDLVWSAGLFATAMLVLVM